MAAASVPTGPAAAGPQRRIILALGLLLLALMATVAVNLDSSTTPLQLLAGAVFFGSAAYLGYYSEPAYLIAGGVFLSMFAGNWEVFVGIPGSLSPQRLLLLAAIAAVVLKMPAARRNPRTLPWHGAHVVMILASLFVIASAAAAGTLFNKDEFFRMFESFGFEPFALFAVAAVTFTTERARMVLLVTFVVIGAYLGLTALFETVGPKSLVWPRYILDPNVGNQFGRARGPFVEAVRNGFGLFACCGLSLVAYALWRSGPARMFAAATAVLCFAGMLFTLQRSVWVGGTIAVVITALSVREVRRRAAPLLAVGVVAIGVAYAALPSGTISARAKDSDSVYARENLNRAALDIIHHHPLVGLGWGKFVPTTQDGTYFTLAPDRPLYGVGNVIHNQYLGNAAEIGLLGAGLWLLAIFLAIAGALTAPAPTTEMRLWKIAFLAFAVFYLVVSNFTPTAVWPNLLFWLLAGVVWSTRTRPAQT